MGPRGLNEDGCESKRIRWSELQPLDKPREKQGQRRRGELTSRAGLAATGFRYPGVEALQNTVGFTVQAGSGD